jgi:hypothetical protein
MLTLRAIFDDLLDLCGVENADLAIEPLRVRVLGDIHAALQKMALAGEDYFLAEEDTVSLVAGTASYALDAGIQRVLEPIRLVGAGTLRQLTGRAQLDDFGRIFLGQTSNTLTNGTPIAFYVEGAKSFSPGDDEELIPDADATAITLHVVPAPASSGTLRFDVIRLAPTYTLEDLCDDTVIPPVPHSYQESILLPLCRYNVMSSRWFLAGDQKPQIEADYNAALALLGLSEPTRPKQGRVSPSLAAGVSQESGGEPR